MGKLITRMGDGSRVEMSEAEIQQDLEAGRAHHVRGTPTFVINGETYPGRIPPEVIQTALGDRSRGDAAETSDP